MTKGTLLLRTFGWACVGFLVTSGAIAAFGESVNAGTYDVKALVLAVIAAVVAGILAVLQSLKFSATTPAGKAASQFIQMIVAGAATLVVADLTSAAAVAFAGAALKLIIGAAVGGLQAYFVNLSAQAPTA